jgi:hypothetical protein
LYYELLICSGRVLFDERLLEPTSKIPGVFAGLLDPYPCVDVNDGVKPRSDASGQVCSHRGVVATGHERVDLDRVILLDGGLNSIHCLFNLVGNHVALLLCGRSKA